MDQQIRNDGIGAGAGVNVSLHRLIAENLSSQVTSGQLQPGQKLPSERQIAKQFDASRATVRTALQHLEQSGLISRRERRSAIVTIRRTTAPYLRIACGSARLLNLFGRLGQMQILPPRCQLQSLDLQQPESITERLAHPAMGADVLICDLEYVHFFRGHSNLYYPLAESLLRETQVPIVVQESCQEGSSYIAIPLSVSPMVLYFNRSYFYDSHLELPGAHWSWSVLQEVACRLAASGHYGLQFHNRITHLSAIMAARGVQLYRPDGTVAAGSSAGFDDTIRSIYEMLHVRRAVPILARAEQLNLFAQRRCAMAIDGAEMYKFYCERLGEDLGVSVLPGDSQDRGSISTGFAIVAMSGIEGFAAVEHLVRTLLSTGTQRLLFQLSAGMPVRGELLDIDTFESFGIRRELAGRFLQQQQQPLRLNHPKSPTHKWAVENLFLELWLGLDNIDSLCNRFGELAYP